MAELAFLAAIVAIAAALAMRQAPMWLWAFAAAAAALVWQTQAGVGVWSVLAWLPAAALAALSVPSLRRRFVVEPAFRAVKAAMPRVSDTELQALEAGTIGFDAELFTGRPDWDKLRAVPPVTLTAEEQGFLDGPVEELCRLIDDWRIRHQERDIPDEVWNFIRSRGFLGMSISKAHGGLGFSAQAQSLVLGKIASKSPDAVVAVMVPNSLGPGELIEKYGTDEQKAHYLPGLAAGREIPCFALTGPFSGSDAAAMRDAGTVVRGWHDGRETLGVRLNWDKRYITLAPRATLIGVAFRLFDPEQHLGKGEDVGVTVALVPAGHPGVSVGRRHLPCGAAFPNGPTWGRDVFIPMDWLIGGARMAGQGWRMLMECLAAGRCISLPATSTAGAKAMLRAATAYGRVRKQFGIPIGRMEGVEEPLARLVETAYALEAARGVTAAMVSRGERPAVLSALMKYQTTERMRRAVNDAMDVHGGRGICDGPANYLQAAYQMAPVGVTVEGANILTRTLIAFAQGALRSHPYLYEEVRAVQDPDPSAGIEIFDEAFSGHFAFALSNAANALFNNVTGGFFLAAPDKAHGTARHYRRLSRASRNFAFVADLTVVGLGGSLKRKQKISGRLADAMSELFIAACALKRYEDDGKPEADQPIVDLVCENGLHRFEQALRGAIDNYPVTWQRVFMRTVAFPFGGHARPASDAMAGAAVRLALEPGEVRDRLTRGVYLPADLDEPAGLLEAAFAKAVAAEAAEKKLDRAVKSGEVRRIHGEDWIGAALAKTIVTESEAQLLREAEALTTRAIGVDHFDPAEVKPRFASFAQSVHRIESVAAE